MTEHVLTNAQLVLPTEIVRGSLLMRDGVIVSIDPGATPVRGGEDCQGDLVCPGLIELHTDNLERHLAPRPGVDWPHAGAVVAHDRELAGCGITTVFDALRLGSLTGKDKRGRSRYGRALATEVLQMREAGALKISHFLHLRAEVCSETLIEELDEFGPDDRVGIVSLMDHTPGQRQFSDMSQLRVYMRGKHGMTDAEFDAHVVRQQDLGQRVRAAHEVAVVQAARRYGAVLASHDDTTEAHVVTSASHGVRLAEFPTTMAAAMACRAHGIAVMMGAPNLIRGGSHSGNVAAGALAEAGLLDIVSSDYVPAALLQAAVRLGLGQDNLAAGLASVTLAPAHAAGLDDRGAVAPGLRADLLRVRLLGNTPLLQSVWVKGDRIA